MADEPTNGEEQKPEQPADEATPPREEAAPPAEEPVAGEPAPAEPVAEEPAPAEPVAGEPAPAEAAAEPTLEPGEVEVEGVVELEEDEEEPFSPRLKPEIPGADLEVDIVTEGGEPLASRYSEDVAPEDEEATEDEDVAEDQPIAAVTIDLASGARYRATGKRKTAVARVTLKPGTGEYAINGRALEAFFPRSTLQRNIRQPLEAVGYEARMDVVARLHGGGASAQAGALRHGISRALLEADPNLRGELKRRGFLTRDARAKERKKAGLKKARKRPQFSKR
jgi:small subunit ribosomal protein S9